MAAIDMALAAARSRIAPRLSPEALDNVLINGGVVVDIRPDGLLRRDGNIRGAVVVARNVLEWRLDPTNPDRLVQIDDPAKRW